MAFRNWTAQLHRSGLSDQMLAEQNLLLIEDDAVFTDEVSASS
jgi:hypothetical protein